MTPSTDTPPADTAAPRKRRSPAMMALISLVVPGYGSLTCGNRDGGLAVLITWLISLPLVFIIVGVITGPLAVLTGSVMAYRDARRWNTNTPNPDAV